MMEKENIISAHPSLCWNCENARKPASDELTQQGWCGCAEYYRNKNIEGYIGKGDLAEGWVDIKARPFGEKSGITTNLQLLTKHIVSCNKYTDKRE